MMSEKTYYSIFPPKYTPPDENSVRVYADGVFDMFHYGHARFIKKVRDLFPNPYVIIGVTSDEDTENLKGKTLFNEIERAEQVMHCRYVDEVVVKCPWKITQEFIEEYKIDYVVHGEDISYDENGEDVYKLVKDMKKFKTVPRSEGVSTSDVIVRILKDYNGYVERSIGRGYSYKDLNIDDEVWEKLKNVIQTNFKYASET